MGNNRGALVCELGEIYPSYPDVSESRRPIRRFCTNFIVGNEKTEIIREVLEGIVGVDAVTAEESYEFTLTFAPGTTLEMIRHLTAIFFGNLRNYLELHEIAPVAETEPAVNLDEVVTAKVYNNFS